MEINAASIIAEYNGRLVEKYSGRFMYGDQTSAVVFDDMTAFLQAFAEILIEEDSGIRELVSRAIKDATFEELATSLVFY